MNTIPRKVITKVVSLDSLFRNNTESSTDFIYKFLNTQKNIKSIKVSSIELPNVWHVFSEKNKTNYFFLDLFNTGNINWDKKYKIIIPTGNYSATNIIRFLNLYFKENEGLKYLVWRLNDETGQIQLMQDPDETGIGENFNYELYFIDDDKYVPKIFDTAGWNLGFRKNRYISKESTRKIYDTKSINTYTYVAENFVESESYYGSSSNTYLFLEIDDFSNQSIHNGQIISDYGEYTISNDVLARITVTSGSNTILYSLKNDHIYKKREYHGFVNIDKLRIRLVDKFNKTIDIGEGNFSLSLEIEQQYN